MEHRYRKAEIDLYYGDETQISEEGYVPYGWQFRDENICIRSAKGEHISCFAMITRSNQFIHHTTARTINSDFITEQLDKLSLIIKKHTVVVLDNARIHQSKTVAAMQTIWAKRQLFIFFLPPYSPHLNIIERLWKEMKARWLTPDDYQSDQHLFYATNLVLNAIGKTLFLNYKLNN